MRNGTYIRPAISEDGYLYLVTGEDDEANVKRRRYIIKYDINSASFVETIKYESDFGFWRGEPSVIEDSKYLFITTFYEDSNGNYYGSNEFFGLNDEKKYKKLIILYTVIEEISKKLVIIIISFIYTGIIAGNY